MEPYIFIINLAGYELNSEEIRTKKRNGYFRFSLKILWGNTRVGSSPTTGTKQETVTDTIYQLRFLLYMHWSAGRKTDMIVRM